MRIPSLRNRTGLKLLLTMSILAASGGLVGGSFANASSLTENPSSFVAGTLILGNTVESDVSCIAAEATLKCGRVFGGSLAPGQVAASRVTLQNVGTVPVNGLTFGIGTCQPADSVASSFHGTSNLCQLAEVTLHDDTHDVCYYPVTAAGSCSFAAGASPASLVALRQQGSSIALSPDHLGGGITFTVAIRVDPGVGNVAQGRQATMDLIWRASQG